MTRGNQRETDRARAQARAAKYAKQTGSSSDKRKQALSSAEIMREKQRQAELKKQGLYDPANDPTYVDKKGKKACKHEKDKAEKEKAKNLNFLISNKRNT